MFDGLVYPWLLARDFNSIKYPIVTASVSKYTFAGLHSLQVRLMICIW